jgi:hypothetical protein
MLTSRWRTFRLRRPRCPGGKARGQCERLTCQRLKLTSDGVLESAEELQLGLKLVDRASILLEDCAALDAVVEPSVRQRPRSTQIGSGDHLFTGDHLANAFEPFRDRQESLLRNAGFGAPGFFHEVDDLVAILVFRDDIPAGGPPTSEIPTLKAGDEALDLERLPTALGVPSGHEAAPLLLPVLVGYPSKGDGVVEPEDLGRGIGEAQYYPHKIDSILVDIEQLCVLESTSIEVEQADTVFAEHSRSNKIAIGLGVEDLSMKEIRRVKKHSQVLLTLHTRLPTRDPRQVKVVCRAWPPGRIRQMRIQARPLWPGADNSYHQTQ